jgi:hypothetical protein
MGIAGGSKCIYRQQPFILFRVVCETGVDEIGRVSQAWNVFVRSNTGILSSNHTRGMDVSVFVLRLCYPA